MEEEEEDEEGKKGLGETTEGVMLIVILRKSPWETRFVVVDGKEKSKRG